MCATAGASPQSEKHSPKSKPVGDGRVGISQGSPGDVSSAEMEHSAPPVPPPGQGKGSPGALGQILPWVDSPHADWKDPAGICPGQLHLSSGSGQDQATSLWCSQLGHNPLSHQSSSRAVERRWPAPPRESLRVFCEPAQSVFLASSSQMVEVSVSLSQLLSPA